MGLWSRLFGSKKAEAALENDSGQQNALLVYLKLSDDSFGTQEESWAIYELEDKLESALEKAGAGEFDGHEFGEGFCTLYMYGSNADRMYDVAIKKVRRFRPLPGSYLNKQFGEPGDPETVQVRVEL